MSLPDRLPVLQKLLRDRVYRSRIAVYSGFALNMLYSAFHVLNSAIYSSVWFGSIAAYYFSLCVIRGLLVISIKKSGTELKKWRSYRLCGALMLFLGITMAGMSIQMVRDNMVYHYHEYIIYLLALYTFCITITAVINAVKSGRLNDPVLSASKNITLTSALMSVLVLQTAMIEEFGENELVFRTVMNTVTGAAVNLAALGIAVHMIVNGTLQIRRVKNGDNIPKT